MEGLSFRYDIEGFANDLGVGLDGISGLFSSYFAEMDEEITSMRECLTKEDWNMLQRVVHNVKGVSANLGINDVFSEAEKFDILLKNGETQDTHKYIEKLAELINNAAQDVRKFFDDKGLSI